MLLIPCSLASAAAAAQVVRQTLQHQPVAVAVAHYGYSPVSSVLSVDWTCINEEGMVLQAK